MQGSFRCKPLTYKPQLVYWAYYYCQHKVRCEIYRKLSKKYKADNPSIGIMLCKTKDRLTAEYALKDINKPIGVSEYKLSDFVPAEFIDTLPSAEDIEKRVN